MKRIFIILTLVFVVIIAFYMGVKQPSAPITANPEDINSANPASQQLNKTQAVDKNLIPQNTSNVLTSQPQVKTPDITSNSAAQFDKLPKEMQEQIKQLSGRNNPNAQLIEVEPGVFIMPAGKGVNVVPVAVMNEDGTVSTHEY